jgi:hypothetical protein
LICIYDMHFLNTLLTKLNILMNPLGVRIMLEIATFVLQRLFHQHVEQGWCFVHPIVCSTSIVGTTTRVSKIDQLKVLVATLFPLVILVFDKKVIML